jgi:hypothetical protein
VVAVLWQTLFLRCLGAPAGWLPALVLFLTVWLIYVADRLLDTRAALATERHVFYRRHFRAALIVWCVVLTATAALVSRQVAGPLLAKGMAMLAAVGVYLLAIHGLGSHRLVIGLKEASVAGLFAVGTSLTAWNWILTRSDVLTVILFSALCWLNCVAIQQWESGPERWRIGRIAACIALVGIALLHRDRPILASAESISLVGLVFLDVFHRRLSPEALRVLADVALLSPVFFLPVVL